MVVGKRLIQSATDIFAGFTSIGDGDYYVRQFRDMKVIPRGDLIAPRLTEFATACGRVLARAHARTGDPIAIDAYIGRGRRFDAALGEFAVAYADQTARDHRRLSDAIAATRRVIAPAAAPTLAPGRYAGAVPAAASEQHDHGPRRRRGELGGDGSQQRGANAAGAARGDHDQPRGLTLGDRLENLDGRSGLDHAGRALAGRNHSSLQHLGRELEDRVGLTGHRRGLGAGSGVGERRPDVLAGVHDDGPEVESPRQPPRERGPGQRLI